MTTMVEARAHQALSETFCTNPRCPQVLVGREPRYLGEHHAGCHVKCDKCRKWTDVR